MDNAQNTVLNCFIATSEFQVVSAKSFSRTHMLYKMVVLKENQRKRPMQESRLKKAGLLSTDLFYFNLFLYRCVPVNLSKYLQTHLFAEQYVFLRQADLSNKMLHLTFFYCKIFSFTLNIYFDLL